jgi:hypothetical protein
MRCCICEVKMSLEVVIQLIAKITRLVPYSKFTDTILLATKTEKKVQCSFGNHQGSPLLA